MKKGLLKLIITIFSFVLMFSGLCFAEEPAKVSFPWPQSINDMVNVVKGQIKVINMAEFKKIVDNKGDAYIIDVREPAEFADGHVPGAINIPRGLAEFMIWKAIAGFPDKTKTDMKIYTYCKIGGRSILTAKALKDIGFTNVTAVDMKIADWAKAGHPLDR
jgi:rhodanese-related sulfurtransferase